jgi:hypothetical protein
MNDPALDEVFEVVSNHYRRFFNDDPNWQRQLSEIIADNRQFYLSRERTVSKAAHECMDRFVAGEIDFQEPGDRGYGRMSDHIPRFAAKHRRKFNGTKSSAVLDIGAAIKRHLLCAYLHAELQFDLSRDDGIARPSDELFRLWVPTIYLPPYDVGPRNKAEEEAETSWFNATARGIHDTAVGAGVTWDGRDVMGSDRAIITHYWTGGKLLRVIEACPSQ